MEMLWDLKMFVYSVGPCKSWARHQQMLGQPHLQALLELQVQGQSEAWRQKTGNVQILLKTGS